MQPFLNSIYRGIPCLVKQTVMALRLKREVPSMASARQRIHLCHEPRSEVDQLRVRFERSGQNLALNVDLLQLDRNTRFFGAMWKRLPVMVRIMSRTASNVRDAWLNLSDGVGVQSHEIAFSSNNPTALLVPDRSFMDNRCYLPFRRLARHESSCWKSRSNIVLWRGGINGLGLRSNASMLPSDAELNQRVRLCLSLLEVAGTDARLTGIRSPKHVADSLQILCERGLAGDRIPALNWFKVKFAIDIDGITNAWSNLYSRLLMGCCVIKVASPEGYKQWYYDDLKPWQHFVPVASDLSDLRERIAWCFEHDDLAKNIANEGHLFAMRRTSDSETVSVVNQINAALACVP